MNSPSGECSSSSPAIPAHRSRRSGSSDRLGELRPVQRLVEGTRRLEQLARVVVIVLSRVGVVLFGGLAQLAHHAAQRRGAPADADVADRLAPVEALQLLAVLVEQCTQALDFLAARRRTEG